MNYWHELRARARVAFHTATTDSEKIRAVAAIENEALSDVAILLNEPWFPVDLRRQIELAIRLYALLHVEGDEEVLSAAAGALLFEEEESILLQQLHLCLVDVRRRFLTDRFGGVLDEDVGAYAALVRTVNACIRSGTHRLDEKGRCAACDTCSDGGN
jgi:hypothetical protein